MAYSLKNVAETTMPIGSIVAFYGTSPPSGWLICDGRSCAETPLATLTGKTTVPDLRGRFIRMIGGNAAGMAVAQDDDVKSHFHQLAGSGRHTTIAGGGGADAFNSTGLRNTTTFGGVETRPINMAFNYIIKANYSLRIISIVDLEEVA